ncbi:hypothetical protein CHAN_09400 [Corynebacterium hansenii]|nr:hypothetical protein CHAN_09400 [Corynebacterium hansenii]
MGRADTVPPAAEGPAAPDMESPGTESRGTRMECRGPAGITAPGGSSGNPYGPTPHGAVARGADQPYESSFGRGSAPARFTISNSPDTPRQNGTATVFGSKEMSGWWSPKNETTWWSVFGELKLDLSRAELPSDNIVLDLQSFFSEIEITVPSGTRVIMDMTTPMTEVINHLNPNAQPNGLTVVLDGIVMFGEIKIREA